jgi:DNA-binding transcriptional MerR regulator
LVIVFAFDGQVFACHSEPCSHYRVKKLVKTLTIGALARATNTKVETIRYYERMGLLPRPERTLGNYRSYGEAHLARLSFVRRSRDLGFSIDDVRGLLRLADQKRGDCASVGAIASAHVGEIERKIKDLQALRRALKALMARCEEGSVECRMLGALAPRGP